MKTTRLLTALIAVVGILSCSSSFAGPLFLPGNNPQPDEENVLFNQNHIGNPIYGTTNQTGLTVGFDSLTDTLLAPSNGQARVTADDGKINNLSIWVPNGYYTDLIMNPFLERQNDGGPAKVTVTTDLGDFTWDYAGGLQNGNNFLTILAGPGEKILKTTIDSSYGFEGLDGFGDLRQPRISGAHLNDPPCDHPPVTPEPCSLALLGIGGLPLLKKLRRSA